VTPQQIALDLLSVPMPSLDNFVPGANGPALAALRAALSGQGPEFVHLWGAPGCGRSHLLAALAQAVGAAPANLRAVPVFTAHQRLYVVDDVHHLDESQQAALFALQNAVRESYPPALPGGQDALSAPSAARCCVLVTSADLPPAQLRLREDVRTRLAWGLVFALHPIAEPERAAALLAYARARGARVDDELVPYMLKRLPRDMRTLVGVLDALDAYALARRRALTVPLLREWLQTQ
jgi:DnaA family protein